MTRPPKARVRQSFERAAATYDSAADVQRLICDQLARRLPALPENSRILDAGCGTGYALGLLRACLPGAEFISLDLSAAMLKQIDSPCLRIAGDLEYLPLADHSIDLYWSSLAVQWCDLARALHEARRVLRPSGHLMLATLGPVTFHELRLAFNGIDNYRHTLSFPSIADITNHLEAVGLADVKLQNHQEIAYYPDLRSLLHAVKAVGANQLGSGRRTSLMSRSTLRKVETAYETRRQPAGLPLTYDILSIQTQS